SAPERDEAIAPVPKTRFRPETDGFAFANSFELGAGERTQLLELLNPTINAAVVLLGPVGSLLRIAGVRRRLETLVQAALPARYGLCGGMAFAALDYFAA